MSRRLLEEMLVTAGEEWHDVLSPFAQPLSSSLHLAVFVEPYLSYILNGSKTVESRFSIKGVAPHARVSPGDTILLKGSGKPIVAACRAGHVWDYELTPRTWADIRQRFEPALQAQDGFWESRKHARFATLIQVHDVQALPPLPISKKDRRGWVVLADRESSPTPLGLSPDRASVSQPTLL